MDVNDAIKWAIAFLPGFVSLFVFNQLIDSAAVKEFEFVFYLVLLTLLTWGISMPILLIASRISQTPISMHELSWIGTPVMLIAGVIVGLIAGFASEKNAFYSLARMMPFTGDINIISRKPVAIYVFDENASKELDEGTDKRMGPKDNHAWVRVLLDGDNEYHGWPSLFSKGRAFEELFLSPMCRVADGQLLKHNGAGALILSESVKSIEFMDREHSECYCLWEGGKWNGQICSDE